MRNKMFRDYIKIQITTCDCRIITYDCRNKSCDYRVRTYDLLSGARENVFSHYSKVMLSTSITSWRRKIEADSSNLEVLSVVRKRQVPFLVQRLSISGCRLK